MQKVLSDLKEKTASVSDFRTREVYLLILFLVAGGFIRIYFSSIYPLWNDEAITANAALGLLETGSPTFPSGAEYWRSIPYTLSVSAAAVIFGASDLIMRAPSIVFSVISILVTYLLGRELYSREAGLISSGLLSFSLWHIAWSTQVRAYILFQLIYVAVIFFIYRFEEEKNLFNLVALILLTFTAVFTHRIAYIIPFVFFTYLAFSYGYQRKFKELIGLSATALISISGFFLIAPSSFSGLIADLSYHALNFKTYYSFLFVKIPFLIILSGSGLLLGLKSKFKESFLLMTAFLPASIIIIFFVDGIASRYLFFALPLLTILTAFSIQEISKSISEIVSRKQVTAGRLMALFTVILVLFGGLNSSISDFRPESPDKSVYDHLNENALEDDILITQWTPVMVYYYRPPDYSLYGDKDNVFADTMKDHNYSGKDFYSGAEFVNSSEGLSQIIDRNTRGWIVLRDNSYRRKRPDIKNILSQLSPVGELDGYRMWKWNESTSIQ